MRKKYLIEMHRLLAQQHLCKICQSRIRKQHRKKRKIQNKSVLCAFGIGG